MIYDHIKNIGLYKGLTPALDTALEHIRTLDAGVELGTYLLDNGVKAIVSESMTKAVNEKGLRRIAASLMFSWHFAAANSSAASRWNR